MKLLRNIKEMLVAFYRSIRNEGHTEQSILMTLVFITDVINCGHILLRSKWPSKNRPIKGTQKGIPKAHSGIAIAREIAYYIRRVFQKVPVYVLKEEEIINKIIKDKILGESSVKFVGFDCEWVSDGFLFGDNVDDTQPKAPVALLQLSTLSDCFLMQLSHLNFNVPKLLKQILEDRSVLKFGVGIEEDCRRLRQLGVNVCGAVDIRFLIQRCQFKKEIIKHPERITGMSLKSLASGLLGIEMEKSSRVRCSNWQTDQLTPRQIAYAANDAVIGLQIFLALCIQKTYSKQFLNISEFCSKKNRQITQEQLLLMSFLHENSFEFNQSNLTIGKFDIWGKFADGATLHHEIANRGISLCQGIVDLAFKNKNKPNLLRQPSKPVNDSCLMKQSTKAIPVRKKPLYHNCLLVAPDGTVLCTCDKKKADWYVTKGIGDLINDDPYTVQLRFSPAGRPFIDRDYYTTEKENRCVVCSKGDDYVKKFVVPRDYRRHFPSYLKDHLSHDVLLLCVPCHQISEIHDLQLKRKLAEQHGVPLNSSKCSDDPKLRKVRSAAKALYHARDRIPESRRIHLESTLKTLTNKELIDETTLKELSEIGVGKENEFYQGSHGEKVVANLVKEEKLREFVKMWREHFLSTMNPKYLPKLWSSDHNLTKFDAR